MSVQQDFFEALLAELKDKGVDAATAEESVEQFKARLLEKAETEEQLDAALSKIPPASIAENIFNMLKASAGDEDAGARSEVMVIDTTAGTVSTEIREGHEASAPLDSPNGFDVDGKEVEGEDVEFEEGSEELSSEEAADGEETESEDVESEEGSEEPSSEEETESEFDGSVATDGESELEVELSEEHDTDTVASNEEAEGEESPAPLDEGADEQTFEESDELSDESLDGIFDGDGDLENGSESEASEEENLPMSEEEAVVERYTPGAKRRIHSAAQTPPGERKTVRRTTESLDLFPDEADGKTSWLFIVLTIILAPIVAVLGVAVFVFFLLLWASIAVLITLILVGLVALAAAGTAISLAGLIFGVIESISGHTAAGMFEIGLALIIAAVIIFFGIWLYNFAIRFLPFIIKKLGNLLVSIFKLFKKAFRRFKELCSSI